MGRTGTEAFLLGIYEVVIYDPRNGKMAVDEKKCS